MKSFRMISAGALACTVACCTTTNEVKDGRYTNDTVSYRVGEPGEGWRPLAMEQTNLAWHSDSLQASLLVNSHCEGVGDSPLEALTNDLMMGTTEREILTQEKRDWSKREALETTARVKLDGVPRELQMFVLKKDGCVYDIVLDASPGGFERAKAAYVRVRDKFDVEARRDRS
jgi:hypothetical protein